MKTVSVIVPIYNKAKYLESCIDSILCQTVPPDEILLIDDGSTDGSEKICEVFRNLNGIVKVIHKENGGLVSARKCGVNAASCDLLAFVDADDRIEKNLIEILKDGIGDADIAVSGLTFVDMKSERIEKPLIEEKIYSHAEFISLHSQDYIFDIKKQRFNIMPSFSGKLFKKGILRKFLMDEDETIVLGEDGVVIYPLLAYVESISVLNYSGYYYIQRKGSMMRSMSINTFSKIDLFAKCIRKRFEDIGLLNKVNEQINEYISLFVKAAVSEVFHIQIGEAILDSDWKLQGKNVILYGAGKVGRSYMRQLLRINGCDILAWVDSNRCGEDILGFRISEPGSISTRKFDYVIVAVADRLYRNEIVRQLSELHVEDNRILWSPVVWI